MASKKNRMTIHHWNGYWVLDLGEVEIWDGADLALLRETLTRLISTDGRRMIGVDMTYVKYIPSGFFGMLYDWHEQGVSIRLYTPQEHVKNMLWFRQFFDEVSEGCFKLMREERETLVAQTEPEWSDDVDWGFEDEPESMATMREQ
jgi:hypothetical protein